ncbi:MAG: glycosyltransferase family 9 protein [Bdellovibrionales bacterium]
MDKRNVDIVIVRMDKIGDLVVSLAVDEHPVFAGQRVTWFISSGLGFIAEQSVPRRTAMEFKRGFSIFEFWRMRRWLKKANPRTIVLLHNPWWVAWAAWSAGVQERVSRRSQWHSFLFNNISIRQSRKASDQHESDYNFDLVEWAFARLGLRRTSNLPALKRTFLRLLAPNPFGTLEARGLKEKRYRVVHPGMGGSALNWPTEHYLELIKDLADEMPVLITGTKADAKYLRHLEEAKSVRNVRWLVDELKTGELFDLLSQAKSVIAPSTGVLHLAAALGAPVVGIYSPNKVEHPRRWGPKGLKTRVLLPEVTSGDRFNADVMKQISVETVLAAIHELEEGKTSANPVVTVPTA